MISDIKPRLKQPLFSKEHGVNYHAAMQDPILMNFIRAYDCIWNLMYYPKDMQTQEVLENGEINLQSLGRAIEQTFGESVFTTKEVDDGQLSFDFESENNAQ
jgi:hypothetical protein